MSRLECLQQSSFFKKCEKRSVGAVGAVWRQSAPDWLPVQWQRPIRCRRWPFGGNLKWRHLQVTWRERVISAHVWPLPLGCKNTHVHTPTHLHTDVHTDTRVCKVGLRPSRWWVRDHVTSRWRHCTLYYWISCLSGPSLCKLAQQIHLICIISFKTNCRWKLLTAKSQENDTKMTSKWRQNDLHSNIDMKSIENAKNP